MNTYFSNPIEILSGGIVGTTLGTIFGITDPLTTVIFASCAGIMLHEVKNLYSKMKYTLPAMIKVNDAIDRLSIRCGFKFCTLVITKSEDIIFNKLEKYLLTKYSDQFIYTKLSDQNHSRLTFSVDNAVFSKPIIDHYQGDRILWQIENTNEIHISSQSMSVDQIRLYIKEIMTKKYGLNTITIHQPTIESAKNQQNKSSTTSSDNRTNVFWKSFTVQTNKTLANTILQKNVRDDLIYDIRNFIENDEEYYNIKGIPYKRGYILHGPPGTGKTSILKSLASHYNMDIFLINMGEVETEKELSLLFQGTRTCTNYHMLVFEDIDRCNLFTDINTGYVESSTRSTIRTFLNELDGVLEVSRRITILTANNLSILESIPALIRPGRIDKIIKLDYCDLDQLNEIYNHFTSTGQTSTIKSLDKQITPAQVIKYILSNPLVTSEELEIKLSEIAKITISEQSLSGSLPNKRRSSTRRRRNQVEITKSKIRKMENCLKSYPEKVEKQKTKLSKMLETINKRKQREKAKKQRERALAKKRVVSEKKSLTIKIKK